MKPKNKNRSSCRPSIGHNQDASFLRLAILLFSLLCSYPTFACLNGETRILKDGTFLFQDMEGNVPYGHGFNSKYMFYDGIRQLDSLYRKTGNLDYLSDKGILLILLQRYDEAIQLYLDIEKRRPNHYATASNIGTAYELLGQNENALYWIRKSVQINPKSHKSSEWIHVKILEAKIKGPAYYTTRFLLQTSFGFNEIPESNLSHKELKKLSDALYYQLNERISFVAPKEPIVAQLLFDLGNVAFLMHDYQDAAADYAQAELYGYTGILLMQRRAAAVEKSRRPSQVVKRRLQEIDKPLLAIIILVCAGILVSVFVLVKYLRNRN